MDSESDSLQFISPLPCGERVRERGQAFTGGQSLSGEITLSLTLPLKGEGTRKEY